MARYTLLRYWHWDTQPNAPVVEKTSYEDPQEGNPNGTVVAVASPFPQAGATLISEAQYEAILAADQAPQDLYDQMQADLDADITSHQAACATAYNDLVANGLAPATATLLTGHTP